MGQILYGSAMTTQAVRTVKWRSKALVSALNQTCVINPKTAQKYHMRASVEDRYEIRRNA